MDTMNISAWLTGAVELPTSTAMFVHGPGSSYRQFSGTGFTYSRSGVNAAGTVTSIHTGNTITIGEDVVVGS
jgi:hypothetical protein